MVGHLAIIEGMIGQRMSSAMASAPDPEWEANAADLEKLKAGLLNRGSRIAAPDATHSKGTLSLQQAISSFQESREKTIGFADSAQPFKQHFSMHPVLGNLSVYGWLGAVAFHNMRHNLQIEEIKSAPGFPQRPLAAATDR